MTPTPLSIWAKLGVVAIAVSALFCFWLLVPILDSVGNRPWRWLGFGSLVAISCGAVVWTRTWWRVTVAIGAGIALGAGFAELLAQTDSRPSFLFGIVSIVSALRFDLAVGLTTAGVAGFVVQKYCTGPEREPRN